MADGPKPTVVTSVPHGGQLWQARFNPAGDMLCAAAYDATVRRWRLAGSDLTELAPLTGHQGWVQTIAFTPDGQQLLSADSWGRLTCWDYQPQQPAAAWSHEAAHAGWIRGLATSPDGRTVASCGTDKVVRLWSVADGAKLAELAGHESKIFSVQFHPDGKSLASGDLEGKIRHWDLASGAATRTFDASRLYQRDKIQECGGARVLAFDSGGQRLLCAGQKTPEGGFATGLPCVLLFDWQRGEVAQEMQFGGKEDGFVYDAQFHPDGFAMAVSCAFPGKGHLWFWRPGEDKPSFTSSELGGGRSLSLHPDGRLALLISQSSNGNGRGTSAAEYRDGSAKIQILSLA